jgi:hypothetical protein
MQSTFHEFKKGQQMNKYILILLFITANLFGQVSNNITVYRGDSKTLTFTAAGDYSTGNIYFTVKKDRLESSNRLIDKSNTDNTITAVYSSGKTTLSVSLTKYDTWDLTAGSYFYDIETQADTSHVLTIFTGSFNIIGDIRTPFDGIDLPTNATRFIAIDISKITNGFFVKRSGDTFTGESLYSKLLIDGMLNAKLDTAKVSEHKLDSLLALKLNSADFNSSFDSRLSLKTSDNISEGLNNLFYTSNRSALKADTGTVNAHVRDFSNPHNVNKTQIGLSNVPNIDATNPANITQSSSYRFVTDTQISNLASAFSNAHSHSNKSTLDLITEAFTTSIKSGYDNHISNISNPHNVTAGQLGVYTKITADSLFGLKFNSANFNTSFDSRLSLKTSDNITQGATNKYYSSSLFNTDFSSKTSDNLTEGTGNKYYTNARAALKADTANVYTKAAVNNLLNAKQNLLSYTPAQLDSVYLKSSLYTKTEINNLLSGKENTIGFIPANKDSVYNKSLTYSKSETNALLNNKANSTDLSTHVNSTSNPHAVTAAQVGNTTAQWNANLLQGHKWSHATPTNGYIPVWRDSVWVFELKPVSSGAPSWGTLQGSLSDQTDLYNVLTAKLNIADSLKYLTPTGFNTKFAAKNTDNLSQGTTNKYYSDALSRAAISSSITGIDYSNSTGILSLTSGYAIPTSTQLSNFGTAYTNTHTHSNKALLDSTDVAFTLSLKGKINSAFNAIHSHSNKTILDNTSESFTTALKTNYDLAYSSLHSHSNKSIIDSLNTAFTLNLLGKLNAAYSWGNHALANYLTASSSLDASKVTQTASYRFVTDTEKTTWGNKQDALGFTAVPNTRTINSKALSTDITLTQDDIASGTTNKAFTATEQTKLSGIEASAISKATADGYYTAKNTAITGATKTKITYDSKGLVTAGADIQESDITFTDITTKNASTSMHGLLPKLPGDSLKTLRGDGTWGTSSSSGGVTEAKVQSGSLVYAAASGSTDAFAITLSPAITSYTTGMVIHFLANVANTDAVTLNVNSVGPKYVKKNYNVDLQTGDIIAGQLISVIYDGTNFQLISPKAYTGPTSYRRTSNFTTTSADYVTVTGLSFSAAASKKYHIIMKGSMKNDNSGGSATLFMSLPTDATMSSFTTWKMETVNQEHYVGNTTIVYSSANQQAYFISDITVYMSTTAGTIAVQTRKEAAGTTTVYSGTEMIVEEIQ